MPDYAVRNSATKDVRIVSAQRPETALRHVASSMFSVSLATAQDGIEAGRQGRRIEVAGEEPVEPEFDEVEQPEVEQRVDGDGPAPFNPEGC